MRMSANVSSLHAIFLPSGFDYDSTGLRTFMAWMLLELAPKTLCIEFNLGSFLPFPCKRHFHTRSCGKNGGVLDLCATNRQIDLVKAEMRSCIVLWADCLI